MISDLIRHYYAEKQTCILAGAEYPRGVRQVAAFWQFAEGDVLFDKPFLDGFPIFSDDYYRPWTPCKIPCNI